MGAKIESLPEQYWNEARKARFASKVKVNEATGCWEWTGSKFQNKPYGQFYWGKEGDEIKNMPAHRAAWMLFVGEIPEGKQVLHKCNNGICVRPNEGHLYLGDHVQNMRDRDEAGRTSKGKHRYNFVRSSELISQVVELREGGMRIENICKKLNIGRTTYYRIVAMGAIDHDKSRRVARANYLKAARRRD